MLGIAFKEWAVICKALAEGKQMLILRKGGISESAGEFRPEHSRFWLYPTYLHEHRDGVKSQAENLFDAADADRPDSGQLRLTHFAEVAGVFLISQWESIAALNDVHTWSEATVRMKFNYRQPGLFVLPVRVFKSPNAVELAETPDYAGCKTWVELEHPLPTDGATAVLGDGVFAAALEELKNRLGRPLA